MDAPVNIGQGFMWITYVLLFFTAAVWDVWKRIIPNVLPAGLIVLFICAGLLSSSPVDWLSHLASGVLVLFVGAVLFGFGWLGGGDVKLWAAGALWAGLELVPLQVGFVAIFGGVLALLMMFMRSEFMRSQLPYYVMLLPAPIRPSLPQVFMRGESIPYGVAIAAGAIFVSYGLPVLAGTP